MALIRIRVPALLPTGFLILAIINRLTYHVSLKSLKKKLGKKAIRNLMPIQEGDVQIPVLMLMILMREVGFKPSTPIEVGVGKFVDWYMEYHK